MATSSCRKHVNESVTELFLLLNFKGAICMLLVNHYACMSFIHSIMAVLLLSRWKTLTRPSLLGNYLCTMCLVVLLNLVLHYSKIVLRLLSKLNMIRYDMEWQAWNRLPTELKVLQLTDSFRHDLKTILFDSVYGHQDTDSQSVMCPRSS